MWGKWPGKTVDQKRENLSGTDRRGSWRICPEAIPLSGFSDEEVITREYISAGKADRDSCYGGRVAVKEKSLHVWRTLRERTVPAILVLNMMDVAEGQGIRIDTEKLSKKLGIPVVPMSAIRKKKIIRNCIKKAIEDGLENRRMIAHAKMDSVTEKMEYIDALAWRMS